LIIAFIGPPVVSGRSSATSGSGSPRPAAFRTPSQQRCPARPHRPGSHARVRPVWPPFNSRACPSPRPHSPDQFSLDIARAGCGMLRPLSKRDRVCAGLERHRREAGQEQTPITEATHARGARGESLVS
jgi:hypothetical protein